MSYISAVLSGDRNTVKVYERTKAGRKVREYPSPLEFFVQDEDGDSLDMFGTKLKKFSSFQSYDQFYSMVSRFKDAGVKLWESDISPEYKVLSKHYYGKEAPTLNTTFFDIEIDYDEKRGFFGAEDPYAPVSAISYYHTHTDRMVIHVVPPPSEAGFSIKDIPEDIRDNFDVVVCKDEREILNLFLEQIEDSDIISGWNSEDFDVPYMYERLKMRLGQKAANRLSFAGARYPKYRETKDKNGKTKKILKISGRVHLDLMLIFSKFDPGERDSYALDSVAEDVLKVKKIEYDGSLRDLYHNNFKTFIRYNARDSELLRDLERARGYIKLAVLISHMDTAQVEDVNGTVKLTEMSMINYCHHELNIRVKDTDRDFDPSAGKYGGAFVLPAVPGLHEMIGSVDVTSLYPSGMRTVNISPDTLLGQFTGNDRDYALIQDGAPTRVTLVFDDEDIDPISLPANEWKAYLKKKNYSLSAYGTVFTLDKQGIIPALLQDWFAKRQQYQAKKGEAQELLKNETDAAEKARLAMLVEYYDKVQSVFKLKLNSTYGACGNKHFKFYDVRLAESTTKVGREVLLHMARSIGKVFYGEYSYPNPSVIYGDTDSNYFITHADNVDEAFAVATYIEKYINSTFTKFAEDKFLVGEGYNNILSVSQEIVASKGIFIDGKKSYMLRVLREDGKVVDKIKITGLAIKKTTLPKHVREILKARLEAYLKGEDWKSIGLQLLVDMETVRGSSTPTMKMGLPKKIKNLETYYENWQIDGKTRLPGHVSAAIFWNTCLDSYGDKESLRIVSGMRIQVYYLKKTFGRFKSIAVPVDTKNLPPWFIENIEPLIDRGVQAQKLISAPLKSILKAIREEIPTRQKLLIEEAFEY